MIGTLERLEEQVEGGSCEIVTACSRLDNYIQSLCKDEMTRPLLPALPKILLMLLGDEQKTGWIELAHDDASINAIWDLLKPAGIIFSAILIYTSIEVLQPYELPISHLTVLFYFYLYR